jgi:hypothetical protein
VDARDGILELIGPASGGFGMHGLLGPIAASLV